MAEALRVRGLGACLGRRQILRDIDLSAERGALTVILGPNGAGKTTLLECLAGLLPYSGQIAIERADADEELDLATLSPRQRAQLVAYVPQRSALDAPLPVETVVAHGRYAHRSGALWSRRRAPDPAEERAAIAHAMAATDVHDLADRSFLELSGGEQRRVLIARALATGARIILLDEPTASLDIGHALALFALIRELAASGVCVVAVLHDLNDALAHADRAILLDQGRVVIAGPVADVVAETPIRQVYGVESTRETRLAFRLTEPRP